MTLIHHQALLRHFADLRDGRHGDGAVTREEKESLFGTAVELLDPVARQALDELNADLLLGTGTLTASGVRRSPDGGVLAEWVLSWPEQVSAGVGPVLIRRTTAEASTIRTCPAQPWANGR